MSLTVSGQVSLREWRAMVSDHGGRVQSTHVGWQAVFPTSYQRELYTKKFLSVAGSRLAKAGRLGYDPDLAVSTVFSNARKRSSDAAREDRT